MTSRVTRSRAGSEVPQSSVTDFFKNTRKPRTRGEKKIIQDYEPQQIAPPAKPVEARNTRKVKEENTKTVEEVSGPVAPVFEKKPSRTRNRTPSRQAELSTPDVTGTPPKKAKEVAVPKEVPVLAVENSDVVLENPTAEKSAIDVLMEASGPQKKKTGIRTVADLQARLAAKGAAKAIHAQNLKNKTKQVDDHVEMLKSPKKKTSEFAVSPTKSKAARSLFSPKKSVPDYVLPGFNVTKSAEKVQEERDDEHEEEGKRMTSEFLKTSRLIDEVKESARERIELPTTYEHLADSFRRIDQITAIFIGQNRSCVASELFRNLKSSSGRDFNEDHLAQILHVYPQSYQVDMREQRRQFGQGGKYELEVRPNLVDDLKDYVHDKSTGDSNEELPLVCPTKLLSPKKSPRKQVQAAPRKPVVDGRTRLDAARQRDRAHVFRYKLSSIVMKHHAEFLESQGFSNVTGVKRMHPLFRLDKHCAPLPQAKLPEPPVQKSSVHLGMKEALENFTDVNQVSLPSFVQKTLNDLKSPNKATTGASETVPVSPKKFSEMQKEQKKNGAMSLLERIRAKEAMKKAADACIDKDLEKRKLRLTLLKDRYIRVVCNHFTAKKAQTMEMDAIAKFVQFSSSISSTIPDITDHLKLMCEVAPMYVSEAIFMGKKYLRFIDNNIAAILELTIEELDKTQQKMDEQRNTQISHMSHTPRPSKAARSLKFH